MSEVNSKDPIKIVVTRAVRGKLKETDKIQKFAPGDVVTMQHNLANELISIRKAVPYGSTRHEAWVEREKLKAAQKKAGQQQDSASDKKIAKQLAAKQQEVDEATARIAELEEELAQATKPAKEK